MQSLVGNLVTLLQSLVAILPLTAVASIVKAIENAKLNVREKNIFLVAMLQRVMPTRQKYGSVIVYHVVS